MKTLLLTGLVAGVTALGAPAAHAHPNYDWGGVACSYEALNDPTPGGQLGGQSVWNGPVVIAVWATHADGMPARTTPISVSCDLSINGGTPTTVATASGTGYATNADQTQFTPASGSVFVMCANIVVGGESHQDCGTAEEGGILDPILDFLAEIDGNDPLICSVLFPLAPLVDTIDPDLLYIDDGTDVGHDCDVYLFDERQRDFVPYDDAPTRTPASR